MPLKTVVALYDHQRLAVQAVRELLAHGIPKDRVSLVSPAVVSDAGRIHLPLDEEPLGQPPAATSPAATSTTTTGTDRRDPTHERTGPGDRSGAPVPDDPAARSDSSDDEGVPIASPGELTGAGVTFASVLLGVAFLSLPAVGPVLAAGPLLAGIAGSGAGVGGLDLPQRLGASGMPSSDAERYARAVRRGAVLVVLIVDQEDVDDAALILARHTPIDPDGVRDRPHGSKGVIVQAPQHSDGPSDGPSDRTPDA